MRFFAADVMTTEDNDANGNHTAGGERAVTAERPTEPSDPVNSAALPLPLVRSALLGSFPFVVHGVTGRVPGLGRADGNLGYGGQRNRADAWEMRRRWSTVLGVDPTRLVTGHQVHGAGVLRALAGDAGRGALPETHVGVGDALITDDPRPVLLSLHADCLPILFVDPGDADRRPAVGVAHAGWRGTVAGVAPATVRAMTDAFGSPPGQVRVWLGPAIGGCCYEVGAEVTHAWDAAATAAGANGAPAVTPQGNRSRFDLRRANALLLLLAGVAPEHIEVSGACTRCAPDRWFSHRAQGATTGRFGAFIALRA